VSRPKNYKDGASSRTAGDAGARRFDMVLEGVGRIRRSYGRTQREHDAFKQLLYDLHGAGNLEAIRLWLDGQLSAQELLQLKREKRLEQSPAELVKNRRLFERGDDGELRLGEVIEDALARMKCGERTIRGYRNSWEVLMRSGELPDTATVRALAYVRWGEYHRVRWPHGDYYWNSLRAAVSAVLTTLFKKYHPFRLDVMELVPQVELPHRVPDLTLQDFEQILDQLLPELRPCYRAILILGTRLDEFCRIEAKHLRAPVQLGPGEWTDGLVRVPKSKTAAGHREIPVAADLWPVVVEGVRVRESVAGYNRLERWWAKGCDLAGKSSYVEVTKGGTAKRQRVSPRIHDLRHSIAQWAADEGVELVALMKYLGHKGIGMTVKYTDRRQRKQVSAAVGRVMNPKLKVI
jgi:integrase